MNFNHWVCSYNAGLTVCSGGSTENMFLNQKRKYHEQRVIPFQQHVINYLCRSNMECYEYFMNYFAPKIGQQLVAVVKNWNDKEIGGLVEVFNTVVNNAQGSFENEA